ncbi:MAG: hypothetical protein OXC82_04730 [Rhodobacteraceae bacterium]|nr:hypothetical protein [Paracoccaceae bacterium]MCY4249726.1 hypothetical protein [Paracoccaceae bacterium]MCY4307481.1 hypothetical protein [Paracoccaceae bacterium]
MFSYTYRLVSLLVFLLIYTLGFAEETSIQNGLGRCEGSEELNVTSDNINLDQKTMTFELDGDIYVTNEDFCFSTDSKVTMMTDENNPSEIDEFEILGPFNLTLAKDEQTQISANGGKFFEATNKFFLGGDLEITNFYQGSNEIINADEGEYFLSTDNFTLVGNVILEVDTVEIGSVQADYSTKDNSIIFSNQVKMINKDPNQQTEINSDIAEYDFDTKTMVLLNNVSGFYGPNQFSGRDRLEYNWNSE